MPNFAIHDGSRVINVIVAGDIETAESVTGMSAIETAGEPWVDWQLVDNVWVPPAEEDEEDELSPPPDSDA